MFSHSKAGRGTELPTQIKDSLNEQQVIHHTNALVLFLSVRKQSKFIQRLLHLYKHRQRDWKEIINVWKDISMWWSSQMFNSKKFAVFQDSSNHNSFIKCFQIQNTNFGSINLWMTLVVYEKSCQLDGNDNGAKWPSNCFEQLNFKHWYRLKRIKFENETGSGWGINSSHSSFDHNSIFANEISFRIPDSSCDIFSLIYSRKWIGSMSSKLKSFENKERNDYENRHCLWFDDK